MKKWFILLFLFSLIFSGCGWVEKFYEDTNYESLTNETGRIQCVSAGVVIKEFPRATIIYSDSNSMSSWIKDTDGRLYYWQGDMMVDFFK